MKKLLLIIILSLLLSGNTYAQTKSDKKFEKDLKKISKYNGFVDNLEKIYLIDEITDNKNTLLAVYNYGIPLTKCFAEKQSNVNDMINFLNIISEN